MVELTDFDMSVEGPSVDDVAAAVRGSLHGPPVDCRGLTAFGAAKARENAQARRVAEAVHALYAPVLERLAADIVKHREALDFIEGARSPDVATVARDRDIIAAALRGTRRDAARYREVLEEIRSEPDASRESRVFGGRYGCLDLHEARALAAAALVEPKGQD